MKNRLFLASLAAAVTIPVMVAPVQAEGIQEVKQEVSKEFVGFKDVTKESYAYEAIMYLANEGIVAGYGNGYYGIKDSVTRGQVSALIARYLKLDTGKAYDNSFVDVEGHMFEKEILAVTNAGYMQGKGNNKFDPKATLTRAEMAQVLTNVFDLKVKKEYDFHDMDSKHWALNAVRALYSNGITQGTGGYKFDPSGTVTRGQYAEFLYRGINLDADFEAEPMPEPPKPEVKPDPKPEPPVVEEEPEEPLIKDEINSIKFGFENNMNIGQTETLNLQITFLDGTGKDVTKETTFEVSDSKIAKIQAGKITAIATGETTLTAKYKDVVAQIPIRVKEEVLEEPVKPEVPDGDGPIVVTKELKLDPVNIKGFIFTHDGWAGDIGNKNPKWVSEDGRPLKPGWLDEAGFYSQSLPVPSDSVMKPGEYTTFADLENRDIINAMSFIIYQGVDLTREEFLGALKELRKTNQPVHIRNISFSFESDRVGLIRLGVK